jgi:glycosyltransferase involved in cell wall biosynthesis
VGALKDKKVGGKAGFVFRPEDSVGLARAIEGYFACELFADLNSRRQQISDYVKERYSWDVVGQVTMNIYTGLLRKPLFRSHLPPSNESAYNDNWVM